MKTILHTYYYDTRNEAEGKDYWELYRRLEGQGLKCFESWGNGSHWLGRDLDNQTIELETKHLFDNQWNTAPFAKYTKGLRVFDWAEDYQLHNHALKCGHYLEQTEEMREIRRNTNACGYCGKQERAEKGTVFCQQCIDSEYLKESELCLLRMRAIDETGDRKKLSKAESDYLVPLYRDAQLHGTTERGKARIAKERADLKEDYTKAVNVAKTKHDGLLWLMDHGINTSNVIYYSHTNKFSFGWRHPVEPAIKSRILDLISEFPYEYEIK